MFKKWQVLLKVSNNLLEQKQYKLITDYFHIQWLLVLHKKVRFCLDICLILLLYSTSCVNFIIGLQKAFDKALMNVIWWALQKHKVSTKYITLIKDIYDNIVTSVRTSDRDTNDFSIDIGLQGSALSPHLFALVMDEVTRELLLL
jgi:hypothetical protein